MGVIIIISVVAETLEGIPPLTSPLRHRLHPLLESVDDAQQVPRTVLEGSQFVPEEVDAFVLVADLLFSHS